MGYSILWLFLIAPYVIMFLYFGFIFDFLDKYNHKKVIKALPFNIRYYYLIQYNKSIEYNLFDLDHRSKRIRTGNISIRSFYFQIINWIYLVISFIIMLLRSIFYNVQIFKSFYLITNIVNIASFIILAIYFIIFKNITIKKQSVNENH